MQPKNYAIHFRSLKKTWLHLEETKKYIFCELHIIGVYENRKKYWESLKNTAVDGKIKQTLYTIFKFYTTKYTLSWKLENHPLGGVIQKLGCLLAYDFVKWLRIHLGYTISNATEFPTHPSLALKKHLDYLNNHFYLLFILFMGIFTHKSVWVLKVKIFRKSGQHLSFMFVA